MNRGGKGKPINKLFPNFKVNNPCGVGLYKLTTENKTIVRFSYNFLKTYIQYGYDKEECIFESVKEFEEPYDEKEISESLKEYAI